MRQVGQRGVRLSAVPCFRGLAVAPAQWESAVRPSGARGAVPNAASGVATLVDRGQARKPTRMVLEATGGLERAVTSAWATAGLPVVVVPPRQVRDGARATGQLAQTEALAARALAPCADVIRPTPRPLPDAPTQERRALLGRRQPWLGRRPAAPHRLAGTSARLTKAMAAPMTWRTAGIATRDDALETRLRASPRWRDNDDLWQSAKGLGPGGARTLRLARPALGPRTRQQSAAVVGVAPLHGDRGPLGGRRTLWGGRAPGRTVLDRGTLVATRCHPQLTVFDERLRTAGNGKKVALTACRQKLLTMLNARLNHRTPWQPQEVHN
jgi:transposase